MPTNAQIQLDKFVYALNKTVLDARKPTFMVPVALFAAEVIKKRTRLGFGASKDLGNREKLNSLSKLYIKKRATFRGLSSLTRPSKSNLTLTGQMLNSITIISKNEKSIVIGPKGRRQGERLTNDKLAEYVAENGRPFMHLTEADFRQVVRFFRENFGDLVSKQKILS